MVSNGGASDLEPARVAAQLRTRSFGRSYHWLERCESTNDELAKLAREGAPEGTVVASEAQTKGRGRQGRTWHAAPDESLIVSLLLRPARPAVDVPPLTLLAGAALAEALQQVGVQARLKWPNDVLLPTPVGWRKAAGVLTEMNTDRVRALQVIVGIGVNVNAAAMPPEIAPLATSLRVATNRAYDRGDILCKLLEAFESAYADYTRLGPRAAVARFRPHALFGLACRVDAAPRPPFDGHMEDVADDGSLLVRDGAGELHRLLSADVTILRRPDGALP